MPFVIADTTYLSDSASTIPAGGLTPVGVMTHVVIDKQYLRLFAETWHGKMTDSEYARFVHRGKWQSVFHSMRRSIPNDFKKQ